MNGMPMIIMFKDNGATPVPRGPGECPSVPRRPWGRSSGAQGHGVPWKGPKGPRASNDGSISTAGTGCPLCREGRITKGSALRRHSAQVSSQARSRDWPEAVSVARLYNLKSLLLTIRPRETRRLRWLQQLPRQQRKLSRPLEGLLLMYWH